MSDPGVPSVPSLDLAILAEAGAIPGLSVHAGGKMMECASVCLENQKHGLSIPFSLNGHFKEKRILLRSEVTRNMRASHADHVEAVSEAAYGLAIMIMREKTGIPGIEKARRTGGFDYWLAYDREHVLEHAARIEVSGILSGTSSQVKARMKEKIEQINDSMGTLPAYAVIVEFSSPLAEIKEK